MNPRGRSHGTHAIKNRGSPRDRCIVGASTRSSRAGTIADVSIPLLADVDVCVVGAGSAGATAAIAAARTGARTLLIEKLPFLGGNSTAVLDTFYGFYTPGSRSRKVVGGVGDDVIAALRALGPVVERPNTYGAGTGVTYLAEHLKVVWERLAEDAGVTIMLHAFLQDAEVRDGHVTAVAIATKAGLRRVTARVFIDASGDADLCHFAGFGYELAGELEPAQTLTTTFRMANVDGERRRAIGKDAFHALMADAAASGDYDLPRREGSDHVTPIEGVTATIMTRLESVERHGETVVNATDPEILTRAEIAGRRQALEYARFLVDRVPGYESASLVALGTQIGIRETRRVYGDARLTRDDVLSARQFDDQVGLCGAPIEDHRQGEGTAWAYLPDGAVVGIPYATLVVRDAANVLVAGRCFSATHDAHASVRSMAQCMAMGQAAGTAAAMAVAAGETPRALPIGGLLDRLRADGAILAPAPDAEA
jgi:glycine/D-amino acid oxidase-like deaminating enzyme